MKILQATSAVGWSGGTEQCLLLAKYMKQEGHEVAVLCKKGSELERKAVSENLKVLHFPFNRNTDPLAAYKLAKLIKGYDLVNTHIPKAHWWLWQAKLFYRDIKLVYTRRVHYEVSKLSMFTKYKINTDFVICVSQDILKMFENKGYPKQSLAYIPSGVELDRFNPSIRSDIRERLKIRPDEIVFVNVANFSHVKGQHILLPAFAELIKKFKLKAKLLLVGRDTDSQQALSLIDSLDLKGSVIPLGFRRDVPQILKGSDIFVFPSLNEGIAGSVLQAMAMKKIVVSTTVGGIGTYLKDSVNGIAVKENDVESLVEGMRRALENLGNERMKEAARETAKEFDIRKTVQKTLKVYEKVLKRA